MKPKRRFRGILLCTGIATSVYGGEASVKLTNGAQKDLVQLRCSMCHSLDYIVMNSPFLNRAAWETEVRKMVKVMGAPIPEDDVAPIVEYLSQHYGAN
ncbi:MAG: cytochrome c [Pseudomonadota bacterium]|nr:cytochrome c [Pseudomonadota bacterium]